MRPFLCALWFSTVVYAAAPAQQVITITEYRKVKCSTTPPVLNHSNTQSSGLPTHSSSSHRLPVAPVYSSSSRTSLPIAYSPAPSHGGLGSTGPNLGSPPPMVGAPNPGSASDEINTLFWYNYGQAIMQAVPIRLGSNNAFFIGGEGQKGPLAGDGVNDTFENAGIYNIANNLLDDSNPFYTPSALHGYDEALRTYLDYVDLEADATPSDMVDLMNAQADAAYARNRMMHEDDLAWETYNKYKTRGTTGDLTYNQWVMNGNAPNLIAAREYEQEKAATLSAVQRKISGPKAAQIMTDRTNLNKAFDQTAGWAGYNMAAAVGSDKSPQEKMRGEGTNPATRYVAYYEAPTYRKFVQDQQTLGAGKTDSNYNPQLYNEFGVDTGKSTSDYKFGQTSVSAKYSTGWFFSYGASGEHTSETSSIATSSSAATVSVNMTFDKIEAIPVYPGGWNFDVTQYKLREDAPGTITNLMRPTQLVVASRLGYKITVGDELADTLDTHFKEVTKVGGGCSKFGIRIWGGDFSKTDERNTHESSWDRASRTIVVQPRKDASIATLIGVVAERFAIRGHA